jgi:hypothetical protein
MQKEMFTTIRVIPMMILAVCVLILSACKKEKAATAPESMANTLSNGTYFTSSEKIPISVTLFIRCANNITVEDVVLSGSLKISTIFSISNNKVKGTSHFKTSGLSGVGSISGVKYQATSGTISSFSGVFTNGQYQENFLNEFRIVTHDNSYNLLIHENGYYTFHTDGTVSSDAGIFSAACQ